MAKIQRASQNRISRGNKKTHLIIIVVLLILFVIAIAAILATSGLVNISSFDKKEVKVFRVQDKCSLIVGRLIHVIRDVDDCRINCRADCSVRKLTFIGSNFTLQNEECNQCVCYCK